MNILVWVILCLIWGSTWIFIKIGLTDLPPITFSAARFSLAVVILAPLIRLLGFRMPSGRREWRLVALTGFLQFSLNWRCPPRLGSNRPPGASGLPRRSWRGQSVRVG